MKFQVRLILRRAKRFSKDQKNGYKIRQTLFGLLGAMFLLPSVTGCVGAVDQASELNNAISTTAVVKIKGGKEKIRPDREYLVSWKINNAQLFYRYNLIESFSPRAPGAQPYTKEYPIMRTGPNSSFSGSKSFGKTEIGVYTYFISQCKVSFDLKPDPNIISSCFPLGLCFPGSECTSQDSIEVTNKLPPDTPKWLSVGPRAVTGGQAQLRLSWPEPVGAENYEIWENTRGQNWVKLSTTSETSYTLTKNAEVSIDENGKKVSSFKEYSFRVRASNNWGYSGYISRTPRIHFNMVEHGSCRQSGLCLNPPPPTCDEEGRVILYNQKGVCSFNCYYEQPKTVYCPGRKRCKMQPCLDDAKPCTNEKQYACIEFCNGEFCDSPPPPHCSGETSIRYRNEGVCVTDHGDSDGVVDTGRSAAEERCEYDEEYWLCEDCNSNSGKCNETPELQNIVRPCHRNSDCGTWGTCKLLTPSECAGLPLCEKRTKCEYDGIDFHDDPTLENMLHDALGIHDRGLYENDLKRVWGLVIDDTDSVKFSSLLKLNDFTRIFWGRKGERGYVEGVVFEHRFYPGTVIADRFHPGVFNNYGKFVPGFVRHHTNDTNTKKIVVDFAPGLYSKNKATFGLVTFDGNGKIADLSPSYSFNILSKEETKLLYQLVIGGRTLKAKIDLVSGRISADVLFWNGEIYRGWKNSTISEITNNAGIVFPGWKEIEQQLSSRNASSRNTNIRKRKKGVVIIGGVTGQFGNNNPLLVDCKDGFRGLDEEGIWNWSASLGFFPPAMIISYVGDKLWELMHQGESNCKITVDGRNIIIGAATEIHVEESGTDVYSIRANIDTGVVYVQLEKDGEEWIAADPDGMVKQSDICKTIKIMNFGGNGVLPIGTLKVCKEDENGQQEQDTDEPNICVDLACKDNCPGDDENKCLDEPYDGFDKGGIYQICKFGLCEETVSIYSCSVLGAGHVSIGDLVCEYLEQGTGRLICC